MAKKKTILDLYKMKENGEKAVWMVMYDSLFASYAEDAGMDMILCGDSMGMIVYGWQGTVPVTMDMSIAHCQGVRRGAPNTYLIGDLPFGAYHASVEDAVRNAVRFYKEADVDAVKLEGGVAVADKIEAITKAGMVVFGHIGLTPQSSASMGGFKAQGRTTDSAKAVIEDASPCGRRAPACCCSRACRRRSAPTCTRCCPYPCMASAPEPTATDRCSWPRTRWACTRTSRPSSPRSTATSAR